MESGLESTYTVKVLTDEENPLSREQRVDQWFTDARVGSFIHWGGFTGGTGLKDGCVEYRSAQEFEQAAKTANWSADVMLEPIAASGAKYVIIANFHSGAGYYKLCPSEVPGTQCTTRDFYSEILDEADELGLKVLVYISCDPQLWNVDEGDWIDPAYRTEEGWRIYAFDVVDELINRYGEQIDGFFFDGAGNLGPNRTSIWNSKGTFQYVHDRDPEYIIMANPGNEATVFYDYDVMHAEFTNSTADPLYNFPSGFVNRPIVTDLCVDAPVFVSKDYLYIDGRNGTGNTYDSAIKKMVCNAGNKERWITDLIFGPMIDGTLPSAPDILADDIGDFLNWAGEAIYNTVPGQYNDGYEGGYCNDSSYAVTTQNSSAYYIHVLTLLPAMHLLRLPIMV